MSGIFGFGGKSNSPGRGKSPSKTEGTMDTGLSPEAFNGYAIDDNLKATIKKMV